MKKVEREHNWCSFDKLDGKKLVQDEMLRVEWPNGRITVESVIIQKWSDYIEDHGHGSHYPQERAMVGVIFNGLRQLAPLEGLRAERIGGSDVAEPKAAEGKSRLRRTTRK